MTEALLTIGGSVGGTLVVVIIAFWRISSEWGETKAEVRNVQGDVTEVKAEMKEINGKCGSMTERLAKIETRLNGWTGKRRKH